MKAVVLARGKGTRMRQSDGTVALAGAQAGMADAGVKAMIPLRRRFDGAPGRPFLDYVLSALADAGCRAVCLVVGPDDEVIRKYYAEHPTARMALSFCVQQEPRGTADALLSAEAFTGDGAFLALNSDNYYPVPVLELLADLGGPGLPAFRVSTLTRESNIDRDRVRAYAILRISSDGWLEDIIEKPDAAAAAAFGDDYFVSMNCWRFDRSIYSACREVAPSPRGELELPNAVRHGVRVQGARVKTVPVESGVLDLSRRADIPEVERRLASIDPRP